MISSKVLEMSVYIRALEAQALCRGLSKACHFIWHVFENVSKRSLFGDIMKHFCKTWKTENDWIIVELHLEGHWTRAMLNLLLNDAVWKRWRPLVCVHRDLEQHPDLRGPFIPSQPHSWRHCSHPHTVIQPGFTVFSTILPASPTAAGLQSNTVHFPSSGDLKSNSRALEAGPVHTSLWGHAPSTWAKVLREKDFCFCSLATKTKIKITVLCAHFLPAHTVLYLHQTFWWLSLAYKINSPGIRYQFRAENGDERWVLYHQRQTWRMSAAFCLLVGLD